MNTDAQLSPTGFTSPDPYFQIDAGNSLLEIRIAPYGARFMLEVWRDQKILCRVYAGAVDGVTGNTFTRSKDAGEITWPLSS
jgi:hypothetical protein